MRRFIGLIGTITLCFIFVFALNQAQEDEAIQIPYTVYADDLSFHEIVTEFLSNLKNELLANEILVVFTELDEHPQKENYFIRLHFNQPTYGNIFVYSYVHHPDIQNTSPLLKDNSVLSAVTSTAHNWTLAHISYAIGNYQLTKSLLHDYLNIEDSCDREIHRMLGNIAILEGEYELASTYFECTLDDLNYPTPVNLAWSYVKLGELELAIELINPIIQSNELNGFPTFGLLQIRSQLYALAFDYDNAILDINEAILLAEENEVDNLTLAELYTIRGEIIFLIYEWDRVEENFDMAIELDPTYAPAYYQRGVLFYTMASREDALADFEMYLELEPDGLYAEKAEANIESIRIEIEALDG